jgi:hypothetical protein
MKIWNVTLNKIAIVFKLKAVELSTGFNTDIIVIPPNFDREARIQELKIKLFGEEKLKTSKVLCFYG